MIIKTDLHNQTLVMLVESVYDRTFYLPFQIFMLFSCENKKNLRSLFSPAVDSLCSMCIQGGGEGAKISKEERGRTVPPFFSHHESSDHIYY